MSTDEDRYAGRPFLRLLECLALDAIDAVSYTHLTLPTILLV